MAGEIITKQFPSEFSDISTEVEKILGAKADGTPGFILVSSLLSKKVNTTANATDIITNKYKDLTVAGAIVDDVIAVSNSIRASAVGQYYAISANVTAVNTVRIYFSQLSVTSSIVPIVDPAVTSWIINLTIIK